MKNILKLMIHVWTSFSFFVFYYLYEFVNLSLKPCKMFKFYDKKIAQECRFFFLNISKKAFASSSLLHSIMLRLNRDKTGVLKIVLTHDRLLLLQTNIWHLRYFSTFEFPLQMVINKKVWKPFFNKIRILVNFFM